MLSLGIDIGATKAHGVVLDQDNKVVAEEAMFTIRGSKGVRSVLMDIAATLADRVGIPMREFDSVGIGIPGVVNRQDGEITSAINLRIERMPLRKMIATEFRAPIRLDNDVKATVVAAGMLLDSLSVTYLNFGTGVAAATLEGRLIRGQNNAAGEVGHIVVDSGGSPCRCGQTGCIETILGGSYLAPRLEMLELDWSTLDADQTSAGQAVFSQSVQVISRLVTLVSLVYGSEHIVLGGGVIAAAPWVLPAVRQRLSEWGHAVTFPDYARIAQQTTVLEEDSRAPAIGAALIGQGWTEGYKL